MINTFVVNFLKEKTNHVTYSSILKNWDVACGWNCSSWKIDGLMQERRNSIANALELHLSCTKPSRYQVIYPTQSIPWLLMICWSTKPEHLRPVDCPSFPGIFWFQLFEKKNNFQGKDKLFFQTMIPNELGQVPHTIECKIPQCTVHKLTSAWECWMIYHIANASYLIVPRVPSSYEWVGVQWTHNFQNKGSK